MLFQRLVATAIVALVCSSSSLAMACPFCSAVSLTFDEEIDSSDAVVIARMLATPKQSKTGSVNDVPKAAFEIDSVIRGSEHLKGTKTIETVYFGDGKKGQAFLVLAVNSTSLSWSTPLRLTDRAVKYLGEIGKLPDTGPKRLAFFQDYLEDSDDMLARDAYDEFAKAPYEAVKQLKPDMKHDQLIRWIEDPNVPASRRRLYLTMLGVCGVENDLVLLESMLRSDDRKRKGGLDALIACYLTLKGPAGMPLIEELYLKNKKAEYADTYAAIMALRFHGNEADVVPKERLVKGLRYMLERPQLADLVIPDLARWEDWESMDRLVKLFKEADQKNSWVRVPVINYLRACPLPDAKKRIEDLEKFDPDAVKRANTFFPLGGTEPAKS